MKKDKLVCLMLSLILAMSVAIQSVTPIRAEGQNELRHRCQLGGELKEILGCNEEMLLSGNYNPSDELYSCVIWLFDIDYEEPIRG